MSLWSAFALPSLTTLLLIVDLIARRRILTPRDRALLIRAMALLTIVFYPMAIGVVHVDAYHFGYTAYAPAALAILAIAAAPRFFRIACALLVVLIAFDLHLLPSLNVFDYIIDPIGGLFAIGWTIATAITSLRRRVSPQP